MHFDIIGEITDIETIAVGSKIREVKRLGKQYGRGQTDNQVRFLSRGPGYSVFLTPTEAVLALHTAMETGCQLPLG